MSALRDLNETVGRGVSLLAPGTNFARVAKALALTHNRSDAVAYAEQQWGDRGPAAILKAAVDAGSIGNTGALAEHRAASSEFITALRPMTILGRMSGYRSIPPMTKVPQQTAGSAAYWVGEGKPIPVSSITVDMIELDVFKLASLIVTSRELATLSSPSADALIRSDLLGAVAAMQDRALVDPAAAGVAGVSPPSITNGATSIASTGSALSNVAADFGLLFDELTSNGIPLAAPYFLMAPETAISLSLMNTTGTGFLSLGTRGSATIAGVPVLASASVPSDIVVLLDAAELIVCDTEEIAIDLGQHASVQLNSTPDNPATAATVLTSSWQHNLVCWRVTRLINWTMRREGAVAVLTGVNY